MHLSFNFYLPWFSHICLAMKVLGKEIGLQKRENRWGLELGSVYRSPSAHPIFLLSVLLNEAGISRSPFSDFKLSLSPRDIETVKMYQGPFSQDETSRLFSFRYWRNFVVVSSDWMFVRCRVHIFVFHDAQTAKAAISFTSENYLHFWIGWKYEVINQSENQINIMFCGTA